MGVVVEEPAVEDEIGVDPAETEVVVPAPAPGLEVIVVVVVPVEPDGGGSEYAFPPEELAPTV